MTGRVMDLSSTSIGRVDILWRIFEKRAKKLKMKSQERKTLFLVNYSENI